MSAVLSIEGLCVDVPKLDRRIVDDVSLRVEPGRISALVGESGSGKSTVALAVLGYAKAGASITEGRVEASGVDVLAQGEQALRRFRREHVSYVPQDPGTALNPAVKIRTQFDRVIGGRLRSKRDRLEAMRAALRSVSLPDDDRFLGRYPAELSGGQQQRTLIAMAVVNRPSVIVWDEPTTGLDVVTKQEILSLIRRLSSEHRIAGLYISHDLAAVAEIADDVSVMQYGRIVEQGGADRLLRSPEHAYTKRLLAAAPSLAVPSPPTLPERPVLLSVSGLDAWYGRVPALRGIELEVRQGECLALVGESGSGKSTLSRTLVGVGPKATGSLRFDGEELPLQLARRTQAQRGDLQYVFQNPYGSFQPRRTVGASIALAAEQSGRQARSSVGDELERVGLDAGYADRYPDELSGGERQRASLARALIRRPKMILCDEITSALDVSIQAQIIELLQQLMGEGVSLLFVTHDLAVAKALASQVVVLQQGAVAESAPAERLFESPGHPYTCLLLEHNSSVESALQQRADVFAEAGTEER